MTMFVDDDGRPIDEGAMIRTVRENRKFVADVQNLVDRTRGDIRRYRSVLAAHKFETAAIIGLSLSLWYDHGDAN